MISDFAILGVEEGSPIPRIKAAFRQRAKELHPDLSTDADALSRHELFIEVCAAYRRLLGGGKSDSGKRERGAPASSHYPVPHADQAYVFYRQGMKWFMAIHPSNWNLDEKRMLETPIAGHEAETERNRQIVQELVRLFPKAYYYFSIVVHEYPDSEWAYDSGEKMRKIEERILMYRRIVESFTTWRKDGEETARRHRESHAAMEENRRAIRRDMPKDW